MCWAVVAAGPCPAARVVPSPFPFLVVSICISSIWGRWQRAATARGSWWLLPFPSCRVFSCLVSLPFFLPPFPCRLCCSFGLRCGILRWPSDFEFTVSYWRSM
ncbi:hypothetical protein VFPFJ_09922 [Purpureocillium lilacinum]|uniref:Uncharacterized protein n=1 Tax=Purpureocillium lilacinum TaxID=33203 RepID=A0A179GNE9_PURLI|nr:hypothetical protein VFPFJ_09922 [Purpureocillium lilacinum]OAQ79436.1 hypothetical protein VFPFJ_09922 [Purpureocillium lilacinum]